MVSIPNTLRKLREATFFLSKLHTVERNAFGQDPEEFAYYLSAFLSAARSVTLMLQVEQKVEYDQWFASWKDSLSQQDKELLHFMNQQRRIVVHVGEVQLGADLQFVPVSEIRFDKTRSHPSYGIHWFGPPGVPEPRIGRKVNFFEEAKPPAYVIDMCERYLALLKGTVQAFEQKHRQP